MSRLEIYTVCTEPRLLLTAPLTRCFQPASSPSVALDLPIPSGRLATSCTARSMSQKRPQRPHPRLQSFAALALPTTQTSDLSSFHPHANGHLSLSQLAPLPSANPFSPTHHASTRGVTEIIPGLYISDLSFAENPACLSSHRITHVLSALPDAIYIPPATLLHPHPPPVRLQVRVEDFPFAELVAHLPQTTAWIGDALSRDPNSRVLVHCVEGISRSVSVVAAYLMVHFGWTPNEALKFIKNKRRVAEPNFGFVQQLHEYARDKLGRSC